MPTVIRAELWTDVQAGGGFRLALLPNLFTLEETVSLEGEHTVSCSLAADDEAHWTPETPLGEHNFQGDKVIRLVYNDLVGVVPWTEHRIVLSVVRSVGGGWVRAVTARSILADLAFRGLVARTDALGGRIFTFEALSLTPRQHIETYILPALSEAGQGFWGVGQLDNDLPVDVPYDRDTPLSALRKIAVAAGNLEVRGYGAAGFYAVDLLTQIGSGVAAVVVRARKNLMTLAATESSDDQATRLYAFGAPDGDVRPSMALAEWGMLAGEFSPAGGSTFWVTVVDPAGGPGPLAIAGQFATDYKLQWLTQAFSTPILDTDHATGRFLVDFAGTGIGPGDPGERFRIVRSDGVQSAFVDHPEMKESYGVRVGTIDRSDIPATTNLIPNPFCRVWGAGALLPDGWQGSNVGLFRVTGVTDWQTAGQSIEAHFGTPPGTVLSPAAALPLGARGYLSFMVRLKALSGRLRVRLTVQAGGGGTLPPGGLEPGLFRIPDDIVGFPPVITTQLGVFEDIGVAAAYDLTSYPLNGGFAFLEVFADPATPGADCQIDAVQLTISPQQQPWMEGSGGVRLHQAANERLLVYGTPATPIDLDILDLESADGRAFPYDRLVIGAPLTVQRQEAGINVTTRILGWSRDWKHRLVRGLQVSDDRQDVTKVLTRPAMAVRHRAST